MELVLGIDLGTSYFKLGLFGCDGKLHGLGRGAVETDKNNDSRCELPTKKFWTILRDSLNQALAEAGAKATDILALGYSSQASSFVLLDEKDQPLTPLILWPDARVKEIDPAITKLWQREDFLTVTGFGIEHSPQLMVSKLKWFQKTRPDIWSKARRIMTIADYLTFIITGNPVGDAGTASLLGTLDIQNLRWWDEALKLVGICPEKLSKPLRPGTIAGAVTQSGSKFMGLPTGIPFVVGSLDHHLAAIGAGLGKIGEISESTGTVLACIKTAEKCNPVKNKCVGPGFHENWFNELTFSSNGASVLAWYQQAYAPQLSVAELVELAEEVPPGCDGLVAKPCANQYPGLDGFENATAKHTPGHFARAIMESVAATLGGLVEDLYPQGRPGKIVATGGGAKSDLWLQIKADLLGVEFVRTQCHEPACMGAAMLAAVAADWFATIAQASETWLKIDSTFKPTNSPAEGD